MTLPQLMMKIWDGDPDEYFSYKDMNRIEYNANILARETGILEMAFNETTRASQFDYMEAQKLEDLTKVIADSQGIPVEIETAWNYNRTISYVDFERWEVNLWAIYKFLGGIGDRIPNDKNLHTVNVMLFANAWRGIGPYYQDVDVSLLGEDTEAIVYVAESATGSQRVAEYDALLQAVPVRARVARVYAHSIKPRENIPIKITSRAFPMFKSFVIKSNEWSGSGPWTKVVDLGVPVSNAVVGSDNRNTTKQMEDLTKAIIGVSGIDGSKVTLRAVSNKPTTDVNLTVMWSESNTN